MASAGGQLGVSVSYVLVLCCLLELPYGMVTGFNESVFQETERGSCAFLKTSA